jgi:multicomponent K+:H+ antiporter subunit A
MTNQALLLALLALPFAGSLAAALFPANARNREAWLAGAVALAVQALAWTTYPEMTQGQVLRLDCAWLPALGLNFTIRLDGFAWMFAILVSGIGFLVVLYARYYLSPADPVPRFFSFFLAFMGSMLGVVLPVLVPADRLLAPQRRGARRRAHGADRHLGRRPVPVRRRAAPRAHRRQL